MTPLHLAARQGKDEELARLIAAGIPVDAHLSRDRETPLYVAAGSSRTKPSTLRILLEAGANPNALDKLSSGPLYQAKDLETMKILVEAGANPLHISRGGYGMLSAAKNVEEAAYLLSLGVDPNVKSDWRETCLQKAALWRGPELTRFLLDNGADPAVAGWTDLHVAVARGDLDDVRRRLARGEDPQDITSSFWSAWHMCVRQGDPEMVAIFVSSGIDVDAPMERGFQALMSACRTASIETVKLLLESGADPAKPDDFGSTPLMSAAARGDIEIVRLLLNAGVDVGAENQVQSRAITETSNAAVVRLLVEVGADIDYIDGQGHFLLAGAARDGDLELVRDLLEMGANPNVGEYGSSALIVAAAKDEMEIAKLLLDAGADPNYADCDGDTALTRLYSGDMARLLLEAGADWSAADIMDSPASEKAIWPEVVEALRVDPALSASRGLYDAAGCGDSESVRYFLGLGADPNYRTSWQGSPLLEAAEANSLSSVELLLQAGADAVQVDYKGNNALHHACGIIDIKYGFRMSDGGEAADPALIDRLLSAGIPANGQNGDKQTPLAVAVLAGRPIAVAAMAATASEEVKKKARALANKKLKGPPLKQVLDALA